MGKTSIEWCDHSINPIRARVKATNKVGHYCEKVSPGCQFCYASDLQKRFGTPPFGGGQRLGEYNIFLDDDVLMQIVRRRKPTRFFWNDMSDGFGEWVSDEWIDRCFAVMALTPQHTHLVLTKRAEQMFRYATSQGRSKSLLAAQRDFAKGRGSVLMNAAGVALWPLPNVWLGVSAESQDQYLDRVEFLERTPCAVRFVSAEPLLGDLGDLTMGGSDLPFDWMIVGGESGPNARPANLQWYRSIRDQCDKRGTPFFFKQHGAYLGVEGGANGEGVIGFTPPIPADKAGGLLRWENGRARPHGPGDTIATFLSPGIFSVKVGKKRAGRLLDGREHNAIPGVTT